MCISKELCVQWTCVECSTSNCTLLSLSKNKTMSGSSSKTWGSDGKVARLEKLQHLNRMFGEGRDYATVMREIIPVGHIGGFDKHAGKLKRLYGDGVLNDKFVHNGYIPHPNYSSRQQSFSWMPSKDLRSLEKRWHPTISLAFNKGKGFHLTPPQEWRPWPSDPRFEADIKAYLAKLIAESTDQMVYRGMTFDDYVEHLKTKSIEELHGMVKYNTFRMILDLRGMPKNEDALHVLMSKDLIEDGKEVLDLIGSFSRFLQAARKHRLENGGSENSRPHKRDTKNMTRATGL